MKHLNTNNDNNNNINSNTNNNSNTTTSQSDNVDFEVLLARKNTQSTENPIHNHTKSDNISSTKNADTNSNLTDNHIQNPSSEDVISSDKNSDKNHDTNSNLTENPIQNPSSEDIISSTKNSDKNHDTNSDLTDNPIKNPSDDIISSTKNSDKNHDENTDTSSNVEETHDDNSKIYDTSDIYDSFDDADTSTQHDTLNNDIKPSNAENSDNFKVVKPIKPEHKPPTPPITRTTNIKRKRKRRISSGDIIGGIFIIISIFVLSNIIISEISKNNATETLVVNEEDLFVDDRFLVVVDPGHGGSDTGGIGFVTEATVVEQTARYLVELLKTNPDINVVLSKPYDEFMNVTERNRIMMELSPDLMISLHANISTVEQAYGFECFPSPPTMSNYDVSVDFARFIATEMEQIGARLRGSNGIRYCYYVPKRESIDVYEKMIVDYEDMTLYPYDTFAVLTDMDCPSVLVEQCFITNPDDVATFASDEGMRMVAQAYYDAIIGYINSLNVEVIEDDESILEAVY